MNVGLQDECLRDVSKEIPTMLRCDQGNAAITRRLVAPYKERRSATPAVPHAGWDPSFLAY
jgi:hypothetical protein